ncbi:MAG: GNAT family N-acetyltransferase [Oscillospiraceae bacterium]|jgi:tRNA (cmo5U34)-methyltransferase|nr:GNAT family N-acetyltransferase [Oscillospiraceae bacterium]
MQPLHFIPITENEQREFRIAAHRETSRLTYGTAFDEALNERELAREMAKAQADPETGMLAYLGDTPVGIAMVEEREREGKKFIWVHFFYVAPAFRGQGYGRQLLQYAEGFARRRGYDSYCLRTSELNPDAMRFYERNGFVHDEGADRTGGSGVVELLYVKHLDDPAPAEEMGAFFTARVAEYDGARYLDMKGQYERFASHMPMTDQPLRILDIGCGTGIEYRYIWEKAPHAHITGIDLSAGMLDALAAKHAYKKHLWTSIQASYLDWDYPAGAFDLIVSSQTMHHFEPEQKVSLYRKLLMALKPGGYYIEFDFMGDESLEADYRRRYEQAMRHTPPAVAGRYHLDIPFTPQRQMRLLEASGFAPVTMLEDGTASPNSYAILRAEKPLSPIS